jgi:exosortase
MPKLEIAESLPTAGLAMRARSGYYVLAAAAVSLLLFSKDLEALISLGWNDSRYTHILLIPVVVLCLILVRRQAIFRHMEYAPRAGGGVAALAALLYCFAKLWPGYLDEYGNLTLAAAAIVLVWIAGFVLVYGARCAKAAQFPLAMLLLAVPIHPSIVEFAEVFLQKGSADVTYLIFHLTSTPVYREGLVFSLPGITIEVAEECSGIRSAISLLITALVMGNLFLRTGWTRVCCVLLTIPIAIVKNAVRIAILSMLGAYVSEDYLHGNLHHHGGPLFSILSLVLLLAALWALRKGEGDAAPATGVMDQARQT